MRANFVIIGAMKCASSTICKYMELHPSVYVKPHNEPNFFSRDDDWAKGVEWYERSSGPAESSHWGEGSNSYSMSALYPRTARRMFEYSPDLKLIYMVRHPVDRIRSAWIQYRDQAPNSVAADLNAAIYDDYDRLVDPSKYWKQLSAHLEYFPAEQVFIGFVEELKASPETFFHRLCAFLGVEHFEQSQLVVNPSAGKTVASPTFSRLRVLPGIRNVTGLVPSGLKLWLRKKFFSIDVASLSGWSEDSRDFLRAELGADARRFLEYCNKQPDFWSF